MKENTKIGGKRFRLSRTQKTLRNLLVFLILVCMVWSVYGCPLPAEAAIHRLERECLLERGEIAFLLKPYFGQDSAKVLIGDRDYHSWGTICASFTDDWVFSAAASSGPISQWELTWLCSRGDGVDVVPMASVFIHSTDWSAATESAPYPERENYIPFLVLDLPEGAAGADMEMEYRMQEETVTISGEGREWKDGIWLFFLDRPDGTVALEGQVGAPWKIRTWSYDGELLEELEGTVGWYAIT